MLNKHIKKHIRTKFVRSRIFCQNAKDERSPLYGIAFPEREKLRAKLERLYYILLKEARDRAWNREVEHIQQRELSGFPLTPEQYHYEQLELFADDFNHECYELSAQRAADAAYQSAEQTAEQINRTIEKERKAALRSADRSQWEQIEAEFLNAKITVPPFTDWIDTPAVQRIVGGTANRESDYYGKIADLTKDPALTEKIKEQVRAGEGVRSIVRSVSRGTASREYKRHLENIVRTETTRAVEEARTETARSSGYIKAYQFFAARDYRTTIYCAERHLLLIDIEDEAEIERCTPPLHYQCRSTLAELTRRQLARAGGYEQIEADKMKLENAPVFDW